MPLNKYQKKIQSNRNKIIISLVKKGHSGAKISEILEKQGIKITRQRIHQITRDMIK